MKSISRSILRWGFERLWDKWPIMLIPLIIRFKKYNYYWPNLISPKTMNEKITWRMLFDRRPHLPGFAGKYESRAFVQSRLGSDAVLVPLLHVIRDPAEVHNIALPARFAMKASHASGLVRIYDQTTPIDRQEMALVIRDWLGQNYGKYNYEWCYKDTKRLVLFEEFIGSEDGTPPDDYKFYAYNGQVKFIHVNEGRFAGTTKDFFDPDWNFLKIWATYPQREEIPLRPTMLHEMIRIAEKLSAGIDFVRVDLYQVGDQVKFGELTNTPNAGVDPFDPPEWDEVFGRSWQLPHGVGPLSALLNTQASAVGISAHPA